MPRAYPIAVPPKPPTLEELKQIKRVDIKSAAQIAIVSGIECSALGSVHHYPTAMTDQQNLHGLVTESLLPGSGDVYKLWCADKNGVWARRVHTGLQIQTVGKAVANYIKSQQDKYEKKLVEIAGADDVGIIDINW